MLACLFRYTTAASPTAEKGTTTTPDVHLVALSAMLTAYCGCSSPDVDVGGNVSTTGEGTLPPSPRCRRQALIYYCMFVQYLDVYLTFLWRIFTMNSRASCCLGAVSRGWRIMLLSRGLPGTINQWSSSETQNAFPYLWYLRSISNPRDCDR